MKLKTMLQAIIDTYTRDTYGGLNILFMSSACIVFSVYMGSGLTDVYCAKLHHDSYEITCIAKSETEIDDL